MPDRQEDRECGECSACCKPFALPAVGKHDGSWCKHVTMDKGCGIYDHRPLPCQKFKCLWLEGLEEPEHRPDLAGIFLVFNEPVVLNGVRVPHLSFYETRPGGLDQPRVRQFIQVNVDGKRIVTEVRMHGETQYTRTTRISKKFSAAEVQLIEASLRAEETRKGSGDMLY